MSRFTLTLEIHEIPDTTPVAVRGSGSARGLQDTADQLTARGRPDPVSVLRIVTRAATVVGAIGRAIEHLTVQRKVEEEGPSDE